MNASGRLVSLEIGKMFPSIPANLPKASVVLSLPLHGTLVRKGSACASRAVFGAPPKTWKQHVERHSLAEGRAASPERNEVASEGAGKSARGARAPHCRAMSWSLLWAIILAFFPSSQLRAAEPQISAKFSEPSATVGEPLEFEITVSGARNAHPPQDIKVDGLDITYSNQSTKVQMTNFDVEMSVVFTYNILPQRAGRFTIPSLPVEAGGHRLATPPVTLVVSDAAGGNAAAAGGADRGLAFAEIVLPRNTAFIGETIPAELRIYVDSRARWQFAQPPQLQGDGFTAQKLSEPVQNQVEKGGRTYDLVIFKTAVTPAKTGTLALGPFEINTVAQLPARRQRPRFGIDDFESLFNDPFGAFGRAQKLDFKSEPVQLQVRALPPNPPPSFSGAIGQFTMSVATNPANVKLGDPLTLTIKIDGRGNFDRVNAPKLADEAGWRSYPASGAFKAGDNVGISGTKTFEMAVIPEEKKSKSPAVEFTYFDPLTEKYVTLDGQQIPIVVQGEKAPPPVAAATPASTPTPAATPAETRRVADIHYLRTDPGRVASFKPLYRHGQFWFAQTVPLLALICFAGFAIRQRRANDLRARELAELRREKNALMRTLQDEKDSAAFYDAAARCVQLEIAMLTGRQPSVIDAQIACDARPLDSETANRIRAIFEARSEALYAGRGTSGSVPPDEKARVFDAIQKLEHANV